MSLSSPGRWEATCASVLLDAPRAEPSAGAPARRCFETGSSGAWRRSATITCDLPLSEIFREGAVSVGRVRPRLPSGRRDPGRGPVLAGGELHPFVYPFDEVIFLAAWRAGEGVLVPRLPVVVQGRGVLFLGTSGAGKSTTAGLWQNAAE